MLVCAHVNSIAQIKTHFYHSEHFGIAQGLGHGVIGDFHVDNDGFVWLYTKGMLQRFDGHRFTPVRLDIDDPVFTGEFNASQSDGVYFLTWSTLYRLDKRHLDNGKPAKLFLTNRLEKFQHIFILYESDKHIYVANPVDSIYQVRKADMQLERKFKLPVPFNYYLVLNDFETRFAVDDQLEFIGQDQYLYRYDPVQLKLDTIAKLDHVHSAIKMARDTFVVLSSDSIHVLGQGFSQGVGIPDSTQAFRSKTLLAISSNELLVALSNGIFTFEMQTLTWKSQFQKTGQGAFYDDHIRSLQKDRDQNLYLSTFTSGLVKLYPRNEGFDYIGAQNTGKRFVRNISGSDSANVILMGTLHDGLYVYDTSGHLLKHFKEFPELKINPYIKAIIRVTPYRYLVLAGNIYEVLVQGRDIRISRKEGDLHNELNYYSSPVQGSPQGPVFIPATHGLLVVEPNEDKVLRFIKPHPFGFRFAVTPFRDGFLATGFDTLVYMNGTLDEVRGRYVLPTLRYHRCIFAENDSLVLLGTDIGLYRIRIGQTATIKEKIYDKLVYAILPGSQANTYWISTDYGLVRVGSDNTLSEYSIETGVQENEFNSNSSYKSENGKLYFGGINGITAFYPSQVTQSVDSIRMYLSQVTMNTRPIAQYVSTTEFLTWDLSHDQSNISVELLGKGRKAPESYNYQYRMEGLTNQWIDLGNQANVNFHLAPGSYTFYYHVSDIFNPDATPKYGFAVVIRPPIYKRWWFISSIALVVLGAGAYLFIQHKKKQTLKLMYEYQLNEKIQKERMRISRELHDNIGAQMATVKRNINFLVSHFDQLPKEQVENKMRDLEGISTQINQELRDTIWATQNEHISIADFITRLKNYVFQTIGPESEYRVFYEEKCDTAIILGPFLALNLHRICQETLNNAFKHAGATELYVSFEGDANHFKVTIRDNGKGFNVDSIHQGYGIGNIRHRSAQIGAAIYFNRVVTSGSSLEIIIDTLEHPAQLT
jgi:signal transduction histidine kinase